MIKNNFNAQGYKAPVCKVVRVHVEGLVCTSPTSEDFNGPTTLGGSWEEDED